LHFSIGDENKPPGLRGGDGCFGLGVLWGGRVSCGRTARDGEKGLVLVQCWMQQKLAVSLIQAPSSRAQMIELLLWWLILLTSQELFEKEICRICPVISKSLLCTAFP